MAVLGGQEPRGQQADAGRRRPCGPLQCPGASLHGTGASPQTQMRVPSCPPSQMPQAWQPSLSTRSAQGTQACPVATGSPSPHTTPHGDLELGVLMQKTRGWVVALRPRCSVGRVHLIQGLVLAMAGHTEGNQCSLVAPKPLRLKVTYLRVCHLLSAETTSLPREFIKGVFHMDSGP